MPATPQTCPLYPVSVNTREKLTRLNNKLPDGLIGRLSDEPVLLAGRGDTEYALEIWDKNRIQQAISDALGGGGTSGLTESQVNTLINQALNGFAGGMTESAVTTLINDAVSGLQSIALATPAQHLAGTATGVATNPAGVSAMITKHLSDWLSTQLSPLQSVGQIAAPSSHLVTAAYSSNLQLYFVCVSAQYASYIYSTSDFVSYNYLGGFSIAPSSGAKLIPWGGDVIAVVSGENRLVVYKLKNSNYPTPWDVIFNKRMTSYTGGSETYYPLRSLRVSGNQLTLAVISYTGGAVGDDLMKHNLSTLSLGVDINLSTGAYALRGYMNDTYGAYGVASINGDDYQHIPKSYYVEASLEKRVDGNWQPWINNLANTGYTLDASVMLDNFLIESNKTIGIKLLKFDLAAQTHQSIDLETGAGFVVVTALRAVPGHMSDAVVHDANNIYIAYRNANTVKVKRIKKTDLTQTTVALFESTIPNPIVTLFDKQNEKLGIIVHDAISTTGLAKNYEVLK